VTGGPEDHSNNITTMPPRLNPYGASRSLAIRSRPSIASHQPRVWQAASRRGFADEKDPKPATGPNQDVLGHVSEEAADMGKVTGETEPDLGQGTPVQEVRCHDVFIQIGIMKSGLFADILLIHS
jgi:small subunit ribosomal protein S7